MATNFSSTVFVDPQFFDGLGPVYFTGGEESDGSITGHSSYASASDKKPSKKKRSTQKSPKEKSPTHEEHQENPFISPSSKLP
ncbi:hypothetical protein DSO57_1007508 [Entomophthora muscae]|uniref:Uncharacterized protein n=1 Tax=Entomophthora muscae TaxID=34485 RepID=A0ACC2UGR7_9FUNG|nr:hypothetical protein DSO57_1007508 [Entomophthora muscae]